MPDHVISPPCFLFINPWEHRTGPNRYLVEFLRQDPRLAENTLVALPEEGSAAQEYRQIGCRVEIWRDTRLVHVQVNPSNLVSLLLRHTLGLIYVWHRMRIIRPSAVITNSEIVWLGGIAAFLNRIPHVQVFHGLTLEYNWGVGSWMVRAYMTFIRLWNTRLIAVSQVVAQMLIWNGADPRRVVVIPNSFDFQVLEESGQRPLPRHIRQLIEGHFPVIVSIGQIAAMKGQDTIVEAVAEVRKELPEVLCLFGGKRGSDEGVEDVTKFWYQLSSRIQDLKLDRSIHFLEEIDYVPSLLHAADVYVQASRTESFCRAVAEALVCGAPVVASDVGGISWVVGGNGAMLFRAGDSPALAAAIINLAKDTISGQQMVRAGQQHIHECFDARQTIQAFRKLLFEVAGSRLDFQNVGETVP